jgi:hypothetical protein
MIMIMITDMLMNNDGGDDDDYDVAWERPK